MLVSAQVLVPIPACPMATGGLKMTLSYLREANNSSSQINLLGGFLTLMKPNERIPQKMHKDLSQLIPGKLMKTIVHNRREIAASPMLGSVQLHSPKSTGAAEFAALADEIIAMLE